MTTPTTRPPRQRVVFYSHDAAGLGHISRCLTVIEELARRRRDLAILLVTGAPKIDLFPLPFNVDIVRIPVATRRPVYDDAQPITDLHGLTSVYSVRGQIIEAAAIAFRPDVFVADQTPLGLANELRPLLASLPAAVPACRFVMSMDDAGESPEAMRVALNGGELGRVLRERFDRISIRGDASAIDTLARYHFPADLAARSIYTGYCARLASVRGRDQLRAELGATDQRPLIVVATGGGSDGTTLLRSYLEMWRDAPMDAVSFVVTGPLLDSREAEEIGALLDQPGIVSRSFVPDLPRYLGAADVAVTMGGYSTTAELLASGVRAIVAPREKPWPEQRLRAELLAGRGLLRMILADDVTPARLRAEITAALAEPRPGLRVDCNGARRSAEEIIALLPA